MWGCGEALRVVHIILFTFIAAYHLQVWRMQRLYLLHMFYQSLMLLHYATLQVLLDRLDKLNHQAVDLDVNLLDKKIDQMMPELGFMPQDNDRLVASYSGGWQMRMCLGKLLLQVTYHCRGCRLGDVLAHTAHRATSWLAGTPSITVHWDHGH